MEEKKRLGRGLDEVSHYFLSTEKPVEQPAPEEEGKEEFSPAIFITSSNGVIDKSFLSCNLSIEIARFGQKIAIVDADPSIPTVQFLMGQLSSETSSSGKISAPEKMNYTQESISVNSAVKFKLISGGTGFEGKKNLIQKIENPFVENMMKLHNDVDVLLINASNNFVHFSNNILFPVQKVVLLMLPLIKEMVLTYGLVKKIFSINDQAEIGIVINNSAGKEQAEAVFEKLQGVIKKRLNKSIHYCGFLPKNAEIAQSILSRKPLSLFSSNAQLKGHLKEIARNIIEKFKVENKRKGK